MSSPNATPSSVPRTSSLEPPGSLSVSIVVYTLDEPELLRNLLTLRLAADRLPRPDVKLFLIDNSETGELRKRLNDAALLGHWPHATILSGHGNIGYGAGHNLAIRQTSATAHLVLNPDVELDPDTLRHGLLTLSEHASVLVGAVGRDANGAPGYLSKRMPSIGVFYLRGFAPVWFKKKFTRRLAHYEYHDLPKNRVSDVTLVSGAFMLCRTDALRAVGGFDERYFLHFEDLDLSLRLHKQGRVLSDPRVTIIHHGGHAAKKGAAHLKLFLRSAVRFFNTHGWRWL
jgi:GT2 family glycosyltransferase